MKLILACTAMALLSTAVELARVASRRSNSTANIYRTANITPVPQQILKVRFGNVEVFPGMEIRPSVAKDLPRIDFDYEIGRYYTFIVISKTWPFPYDPFLSPSVLALYVDIYGGPGRIVIGNSSEIATWVGPCPPPGSGSHQYLLFVYRQRGILDTTDEQLRR
ncbi:protein D1-like [Maniola jurtina]|uniref:protein D1-like n=1 Tax=Maniola jurtina TaxID=191418 RepID=UPI001E689E5B|nr:protein D1-like [Maniola jurtina]